MRSIASIRLRWPSTRFDQVGEFASSKSAMKTRAPELSALITIFRSVGPVISTRRSCRSGGRLRDPPRRSSRIPRVSSRKSGSSPASSRSCRAARAAEQLLPPAAERALEVGDERQRVAGEDSVVDDLPAELDACREIGHRGRTLALLRR